MSPTAAWAQDALPPFTFAPGRLSITERSDFSKYVDGRYVGHVYREARLGVEPSSTARGAVTFSGEALVSEETTRDERAVARRLEGSVPIRFVTGPAGSTYETDEGYPILRGLPASPPKPAVPGARWIGEGTVVVRPRAEARATRVRVLVEYEYLGTSTYQGAPTRSIRARYAVRYRGGDSLGDTAMRSAEGGRTADITVSMEDGETLFIRETIDETYTFSDGPPVRLKGFILHFHRGSTDADRDRIAMALSPGPAAGNGSSATIDRPPSTVEPVGVPLAGARPSGSPASSAQSPAAAPQAPSASGLPGTPPGAADGAASTPPGAAAAQGAKEAPYELGRSGKGVVLLLYDLRFAPDSDALLPSERPRLDAIAAALAKVPDRTFLVEGHTADLGKAAGQYELSERRARRIVDELVARGIPAGRFVYRGLGADRPVASNDTEANRARNRRVEITILD